MLRTINLVGQQTVWACIYLQIFSARVHSSGRRTLAINHCSHNISKLSSIQPTLVCFLPRSKVVVVQCQQQPHPYILHLSISMSKYTYLCLAASGRFALIKADLEWYCCVHDIVVHICCHTLEWATVLILFGGVSHQSVEVLCPFFFNESNNHIVQSSVGLGCDGIWHCFWNI